MYTLKEFEEKCRFWRGKKGQLSYNKSYEELQVLVHWTFLAVRIPHFSEFLVLRSRGLSGVTQRI